MCDYALTLLNFLIYWSENYKLHYPSFPTCCSLNTYHPSLSVWKNIKFGYFIHENVDH